MFKVGKTVVVVDSVEKAVKFYSEKLLFDLVEALAVDTLCRGRACFHATQADLNTAGFTVAILAIAH